MLPSIGCYTRISNPLSMGYYAYLACIDSWRKVADRVIVVDGGSTDGSLELLQKWIDNDPKVSVVSSPLTHWGERFRWEQSVLNMQVGYETLDTDWVILADADHMVDPLSFPDFLAELEAQEQILLFSFSVQGFYDGKYMIRKQHRQAILNKRLIRARGMQVGWGMDESSGWLTDYPIEVTKNHTFVDPELGIEKPCLVGKRLGGAVATSLRVLKYGHFFFKPEQSVAKCRRWDKAICEFFGRSGKSELELRLEADVLGIQRFMSNAELLVFDHPLEIRRVIEEFYEPGMLGGARYHPVFIRVRPWLKKIVGFIQIMRAARDTVLPSHMGNERLTVSAPR